MTTKAPDVPELVPLEDVTEGALAGETGATRATAAATTRAVVETLVGTTIWTLIWAFLLTACLQLLHTGSFANLIGILNKKFLLFALGAMVVWVVVLLVLSITGRLWLTCAVTLDMALALGMVDRAKLKVRMEPVYPSDLDFLRSPGFLFSMVSPLRLVLGLAALALIGAVVVYLGRGPRRTFLPIRRSHTPRIWTGVMVSRFAAVVVCLLALHYAAAFNMSGNKVRQAFESAGVHWAFWYQNRNYTDNGVVPGLLYNMLSEPMERPADYSKATMDQLTARWEAQARELNATRTTDLTDVNVVSVLSEAFSDPTRLKGPKLQGDPIPFTRDLLSRTTSGTMLAQLYGGGTANMEFETLSGESLAEFEPQVNTPYQQFVHDDASYPTVVGLMKSRGYRAIAVHPYMTAMYQRTPVYKAFGMDAFIHDTTMHEKMKIDRNEFISDKSAFDEVLRQIGSTDEPLFTNLVTMQNHFPMENKYKDPWPVSGVSGESKKNLAGYARGIHYSDQALKDFLGALQTSPEKTAVIFYGDHLPGVYDSDTYDKNGDVAMKSTPFFIWTNFPTPKLDTAALTSPIYFMPLLFEQLNAKVPPFYALLTELYRHVPAMEQSLQFDWAGDELSSDDPTTRQLLHDYRLVQYDLSVGKRYSAARMFYAGS